MFSDQYNNGGFGGGPFGPHNPYVYPYGPPPGWQAGSGGGCHGSFDSSNTSSQSTTETSQPKTDAPKQTSLGVALLILGLGVVLPVGCVVWMLLKLFDF